MLGLRDISSLSTPPMDRRAVVTEVIPFNKRRIQAAIARELARDGQVFFVHNRVYNIQSIADDILKLAPDASVVIGHGQMPDRELEDVMLKFMRREADILVSTTIIESGIDIPTANTMIINDADRFGLSDLHQLRGRVGRYKHRAYCYLLLPENRSVGEVAVKRLKAIEEFSMLGAGFKIAMRDLEIRGAGNILGPEQSGHIAAVGYEMYCQLLDRAVKELRNEVVIVPSETSIEIGVTGLIPKAYIPSDSRRMDAYRRVSLGASAADLERLREELTGAYGPIAAPVERLLQLAELRIGANMLEVRSITVRDKDVILRAPPTRAEEVGEKLREARGNVVVLEPKKGEAACEIYYRPPENFMEPGTLLNVLRTRLAASPGAGTRGAREPGTSIPTSIAPLGPAARAVAAPANRGSRP
jgi:transcription-repair coupling factor (superfamily II helicase)